MSKILIDRSVVEQALDALKDNIEYDFNGNPYEEGDELMQVTASKLSAALEQPQIQSGGIPPNWKLVPVEPTRDMLTTWIKAPVVSNTTAPGLYRAMLAAAPQPPAMEQPKIDPCIDGSCTCGCSSVQQPQVEQEPFLWLDPNFGDIWDKDAIARDEKPDGLLPLYTNPQPPRQPLMEEEICKLMVSGDYLTVKGLTKFVRDIELAHGIKEQK